LKLDVKKSNSSNETPNVMTVGVENYGLRLSGVFHDLKNVKIAEKVRIQVPQHDVNLLFADFAQFLVRSI
jgi:hypothetical protein